MSTDSILSDISSIQRAITELAENQSLLKKIDNIDLDFVSGFHFVGIGKSYIAASKTAASLRSLGFMSSAYNAVDYLHGDIGNVSFDQGDLVFFISNSGTTTEVINAICYTNELLNSYDRSNGDLYLISSGRIEDHLIRQDNQLIYDRVEEMCPNSIILPNTSVLITMLIGDLITNKIIRYKQVSRSDFAKNHPGGNIGSKTWIHR